MNIKQFFKPDKRKIVIWIIIFLIIPIPNLISYNADFYNGPKICNIMMRFPNGTEINTTGACPLSTPTVSTFESPNLIFLIFLSPYSLFYNTIDKQLLIAVFLIISYILSCLIVWIHDKYIKKRSKK